MTDLQALQVIDAGLRTLFDNFVRRSIEKQPEAADALRDVAASVVAGSNPLAFVVEIGSFELCKLSCYVAEGGDLARASVIFSATLIDSPQGGTATVQ